MAESSLPPYAGRDFPWDQIAGLYIRVRKFIRLTEVDGDTVGPAVGRSYGTIQTELPTDDDVGPEQRIVTIPIENKSDYKSVFRANLDSGLKSGVHELVVMCEYQTRRLFGGLQPCIHVAGYPAGTWQGFFDAVKRFASAEFQWPPPLFLYSPPVLTHPATGDTMNIFYYAVGKREFSRPGYAPWLYKVIEALWRRLDDDIRVLAKEIGTTYLKPAEIYEFDTGVDAFAMGRRRKKH